MKRLRSNFVIRHFNLYVGRSKTLLKSVKGIY
nr:MAG TPA: hypothetical protein [Caudoviricetes sp.]